MSPLYSSSNVEKVGGGLNMVVKEKKTSYFLNGPDAAEYKVGFELMPGAGVIGYLYLYPKVRIEHNHETEGTGGQKRKNLDLPAWSSAWSFTCSCANLKSQSPTCKHIGAALIAHFL